MIEKMNYLDNLEKRFNEELATLGKDTSCPNCRGSVLFWIGARDKEYFAWPADLLDILKRDYQITANPKTGDVAAWHSVSDDSEIPHAGIVSETSNGIFVKSRLGAEENSPVLDLPTADVLLKLDYKLPTRLVYYTKK